MTFVLDGVEEEVQLVGLPSTISAPIDHLRGKREPGVSYFRYSEVLDRVAGLLALQSSAYGY